MRVVHAPNRRNTILASTVDVADTRLERTRGLMFHTSIPDDYALLFQFPQEGQRAVYMLFVPFPIDVVWLTGQTVTKVETLPAWTGHASGQADQLLELPVDAAQDVRVNDTIIIKDGRNDHADDNGGE